ncbi:helix-turn-helix transcriptional regulator [Vibrio scophthalmi]|uniref:helix-turn-helix domain-containing protein n=1 Tax=Vibrio scophthalmi TaxID=45658 RepID=UPI003872EF2B
MILDKRLKAIIKEERYSQREFAEMVDIPIGSLEAYLSGRSIPSTLAVMKIVNHVKFEKYTLWLMTGKIAPENGQVCPSFSILEQCGLLEKQSQKRA